MQESEATDFYDRIVQGKDYVEYVSLEHESGKKLEDVNMTPVSKRVLANVMEKLPDEMFSAVEEADSPEEAEEMLEGETDMSIAAMNEDTVEAFEELVSKSLSHEQLTNTQMTEIVESLDFPVLFELGGQVMDMSFAESGAIKDFHGRD